MHVELYRPAKFKCKNNVFEEEIIQVRTLELEHAKDKSVKTESACEDVYGAKMNG